MGEVGLDELPGVISGEGAPARAHPVEEHAEAVQIGAPVVVLASNLLGRGIGKGADELAFLGDLLIRVRDLRGAEVDQLHPAVREDEHVGRLQVAVQQLTSVDVVEREGEIVGQPNDLLGAARRSRSPEPLRIGLHGHAADQLHRDVGMPEVHAVVVDPHDVRVIEATHRLVLPVEALHGHTGRHEQLQREALTRLRLGHLVDLGHSAAGDGPQHAMTTELRRQLGERSEVELGRDAGVCRR